MAKTCPSCGYQPIGPFTDNCPICAEPVRNVRSDRARSPWPRGMASWVRWVVGVVAVVVLGVAGCCGLGMWRMGSAIQDAQKAMQEAAAKAEADRKARTVVVAAADLLQEFQNDPAAADRKYKGKYLEVSGIVERRGKGLGGEWWQQPDRFVGRLERDAGGVPFARPAPIVIDGKLIGVVVVPPQAPFGLLLSRYGPLLGLVGGSVFVLGTVLTSVVVFGPARRRLRQLEAAARRFGSGDLSARAPDKGGDEIAAVATAFNTMADDLAASDRARRQLLADVSHELNTPVTAVRGYVETLTMPEMALDDETRTRYLRIIGDETARLEHLIGDLLDLAKLEGGGGTLRHEPVRLEQIFSRVAQRHERALAQAGVTIQIHLDHDAEVLMGDQDRLEQAVQNLAANAIRFAPRGSTVKLGSLPAGVGLDRRAATPSGTIIAVEDEGTGIPSAHLPHVFDRFYKADTSRAQSEDGPLAAGGSGLGLSIVKAIVERHGGRVSVASRPGRTVFEIWLPR